MDWRRTSDERQSERVNEGRKGFQSGRWGWHDRDERPTFDERRVFLVQGKRHEAFE